jgi:hypothetical protein
MVRQTMMWALAVTMWVPYARTETVAEMLRRLSADVAEIRKGKGPTFESVSFERGVAFFSSQENKTAAAVGRSSTGHGGLWVNTKSGSEVGRFTVGDSGGFIAFYDLKGAHLAEIGVRPDGAGGGAWFMNKSKTYVAFVGSNSSGRGIVELNGKNIGDYSEVFEIANRSGIVPGSVVSAGAEGNGLVLAQGPYDRAVVGVISGAGTLEQGIRIGSRADNSTDLPLAVAGQVYVRVSAENGPLQVGDLLVSSSRPGVAMRGTDPSRAFGAVIGKALEPFNQAGGEGLVRMLVMCR